MTNQSTNGEQRNLWAPPAFNALMGEMPAAFNALMGEMPAAAVMTAMNGQLYEGIAAFNNNWVAFVNRCLKDNLELSQRCAACSSVEEMRRVYGDWYKNSTEHYLEGVVEMANSSKSLVHDTVTAIQSLAVKPVPTAAPH
jgi:hypothetical protein